MKLKLWTRIPAPVVVLILQTVSGIKYKFGLLVLSATILLVMCELFVFQNSSPESEQHTRFKIS